MLLSTGNFFKAWKVQYAETIHTTIYYRAAGLCNLRKRDAGDCLNFFLGERFDANQPLVSPENKRDIQAQSGDDQNNVVCR